LYYSISSVKLYAFSQYVNELLPGLAACMIYFASADSSCNWLFCPLFHTHYPYALSFTQSFV